MAGEETPEAIYHDAVEMMRRGEHAAAVGRLGTLVDMWNASDPALSRDLAANAHCTYACALRDAGDTDEALDWFGITAAQFGFGSGEAFVIGSTAGLLHADLLERLGRPDEAHALLDTLTIRLLMESDPALRRIFEAGMVALKRLEAEGHGTPAAVAEAAPEPEPEPAEARPDDDQHYAWRDDAGEHGWVLGDDAVTFVGPGSKASVAFTALREVVLQHAPARGAKTRHTATATGPDGQRWTMPSVTRADGGGFTDRAMPYHLFVLLLLGRMKRAGATAPVRAGSTTAGYLARLAAGLVGLPLLFLLMSAIGPIGLLAGLLLAGYGLVRLIGWARRNRPRSGTFDVPPEGSLPRFT